VPFTPPRRRAKSLKSSSSSESNSSSSSSSSSSGSSSSLPKAPSEKPEATGKTPHVGAGSPAQSQEPGHKTQSQEPGQKTLSQEPGQKSPSREPGSSASAVEPKTESAPSPRPEASVPPSAGSPAPSTLPGTQDPFDTETVCSFTLLPELEPGVGEPQDPPEGAGSAAWVHVSGAQDSQTSFGTVLSLVEQVETALSAWDGSATAASDARADPGDHGTTGR
jgi:hypothetical protein